MPLRLFFIALLLFSPLSQTHSQQMHYDSKDNCLYPPEWGYSDTYPGECYYDCRRACRIGVGIVVGVAIFVGIITVLVKDGNCSHSAH